MHVPHMLQHVIPPRESLTANPIAPNKLAVHPIPEPVYGFTVAVKGTFVGELCRAVGAAAGDFKSSPAVADAHVGATTHVRRRR